MSKKIRGKLLALYEIKFKIVIWNLKNIKIRLINHIIAKNILFFSKKNI